MFVMMKTQSQSPEEVYKFTPISCYKDVASDIKDLWKLNTIRINTSDKSESKVFGTFKENVVKKCGRYEVTFP